MNLFNLTPDELQHIARTGDAKAQAEALLILRGLKDRDHVGLLKYLRNAGGVDAARPHFVRLSAAPVQEVAAELKAKFKTASAVASIAALIIVQSVAAGLPLPSDFLPGKRAEASDHETKDDDHEWLREQVQLLTDARALTTVSDWAETKRYLPKTVTPVAGYYRYDVTPYLREIADCMSSTSHVREIDFMKGAQIGATVGVLENAIGYVMDHLKSAPVMLLTADAELAKIRIDSYIIPMLQHSGLSHLIRSSDETNTRKTGKTATRIEWIGGGYLVPFGAQNADKLRSISIQYLLEDEVDAFPERVGKDGDPQKLAEARTKAYFHTRKIARISTPLLKHQSRIERGFKRGDQRYYHVPCLACGAYQVLRFEQLKWSYTEAGDLDHQSIRYACAECGHLHRNSDKFRMLPAGRWIPSAVPDHPDHRSYHLSALYSPVDMYPWEAVVRDWCNAWDTQSETVKDIQLLQEFYNNNLGLPFEIRGSKVKFEQVSAHRRTCYKFGQIPNSHAMQYAGGAVFMLACLVDVHKGNLAVSVMGWTPGARCYLIDYWRFEDEDCGEPDSPVWGRLAELIEGKIYEADDGQTYNLAVTLIDAGYCNDTVVNFCGRYASGVYPSLGRDRPAKNQTIKEFAEFKTQAGTIGFRILVDHYKDRMAPVLRREWYEDNGQQKKYHFNAPVDITDRQLKELTVETRREKTDDKGHKSYEWHRPGNAANELWDLLGYGYAAVEIVAWMICVQHFEQEQIDEDAFWEFAAAPENAALFGRSPPADGPKVIDTRPDGGNAV